MDFLSERKQRVAVYGMFWKQHDIISNVPQRSVLFFCIICCYIKTLPDEIESSDISLFADGNKLYVQ